MIARLISIDDVAIVDKKPAYSMWGWVITEDGTIYSLKRQWVHGIILALLFPEIAKKAGYEPPDEDNYDVYHYQRFELDNYRNIPAVRIARGMMGLHCNNGDAPATQEQIKATLLCFKEMGFRGLNTVVTEFDSGGGMRVSDYIDRLREDERELRKYKK